jgi:hypothetical protein
MLLSDEEEAQTLTLGLTLEKMRIARSRADRSW